MYKVVTGFIDYGGSPPKEYKPGDIIRDRSTADRLIKSAPGCLQLIHTESENAPQKSKGDKK